ncbi:MAG: Hpt domain-containing protein [Saprospiraceae bacterium]|nr:Hpt domain-containing protein [Saprospiraceae bacterium]
MDNPLVDLSFLRQFAKGNQSKIRKYITFYLETAPPTLERMQANAEQEQWEALAINAHSLKPQADYMGIAALKSVLTDIEDQARNGAVNDIGRLVDSAVQLHREAEVFLRDYLSSL